MHFTQSVPWWLKICVLFLFLYQPMAIKWMQVKAEFCVKGCAVYTLCSCAPSMLYVVPNREATCAYIAVSLFVLINSVVARITLAEKEEPIQQLALIFVCVHLLYVQKLQLRNRPSTLLLSQIYCHLHAAVLCLLFLCTSNLKATLSDVNLHTSICILAAVFAGELAGTVAYIEYMLLKTIGDLYESAFDVR